MFDAEKQERTDIEIGIPQESLISPIIFLIYIRFLFIERKIKDIRTPSYINDLGLFTSSKSIRKNCKDLKAAIKEILSF